MSPETTVVAVRLFVALVVAAALAGVVAGRLSLPYSVTLVVLGLVVAQLAPPNSISIGPELVLLVLLPGLIFEASYQIEFGELRRTAVGISLLAIPGVIVTAAIVAVVLWAATGLEPRLGFVVGAMVAATDPAAVIATFKRLGSSRRLRTLVEGESLFNDGTGLVVFTIAVAAVESSVTMGDAVIRFVATIVASSVIGALAGAAATWIIARVDDHLVELTISLGAAYGTYVLADALHQSGIIATVVAGLVIGNVGRRLGIKPATLEALDTVWEFIAFVLTALVFLLVGLAIRFGDLAIALPSIAWAVVAVLVGRAVVIYGLLGGGSRLAGRGPVADRVPTGWLHVLFWGGLRGAVAVAMALSLPLDFPQRPLLEATTFGVVLFTLLVQGSTIGRVIDRWLPT